MERNRDCPICLGTKKHFNGSRYKNCNICDDNGKVTEEVYNSYYQEQYDE